MEADGFEGEHRLGQSCPKYNFQNRAFRRNENAYFIRSDTTNNPITRDKPQAGV
jgi:hypothetical protein